MLCYLFKSLHCLIFFQVKIINVVLNKMLNITLFRQFSLFSLLPFKILERKIQPTKQIAIRPKIKMALWRRNGLNRRQNENIVPQNEHCVSEDLLSQANTLFCFRWSVLGRPKHIFNLNLGEQRSVYAYIPLQILFGLLSSHHSLLTEHEEVHKLSRWSVSWFSWDLGVTNNPFLLMLSPSQIFFSTIFSVVPILF